MERRSLLKVEILLFALYRERAGTGRLSLELGDGATLSSAIEEVRERFPHLAPDSAPIVAAVNTEYAETDTLLHEGDEIALIPPVSGGGRR